MHLFAQILLLISAILQKASQNSKNEKKLLSFFPQNSTELINNQCPSFDIFHYLIRRQCPSMNDLRCVINLPSDIQFNSLLNCGTSNILINCLTNC